MNILRGYLPKSKFYLPIDLLPCKFYNISKFRDPYLLKRTLFEQAAVHFYIFKYKEKYFESFK